MYTLPTTTSVASFSNFTKTPISRTLISHHNSSFNPNFRALNPITTTFKLRSSAASDPTITTLTPSTSISTTSTPNQSLKSRLHNGETLYGFFLLSFSPTLAEIAGHAGYDYVVVDMEHGPGGITEALHCLRALAATQTPAILRVPESCPIWAKKALDLGPQGIMFPMIASEKMAKKVVSYCRFRPEGIRSSNVVVRASNYGINEGYFSNYVDDLLIICQVESEDGVKNVEEIAAVDGIDCVHMGPWDLSASMGYLGDPGNKEVKKMLRVCEEKVVRCGKAYLCGFGTPYDRPSDLNTRGYQMVSGAIDVGLFRKAVVEDVERFKMSLIKRSNDEK